MKIFSWNVNGVRAAVGKAFLAELAASEADIYCIQETKAQEDQVLSALLDVKDYHIYANSAERKGYSGVAILTKESLLRIQTMDFYNQWLLVMLLMMLQQEHYWEVIY
mgnify:CR=1 FL=1